MKRLSLLACLAAAAACALPIAALADGFDPFSTRSSVSASAAKSMILRDAELVACQAESAEPCRPREGDCGVANPHDGTRRYRCGLRLALTLDHRGIVPQIQPDKPLEPCRFDAIGSPLGLVEAVERALCNNPQTRQAWASVKAQAAQVGIAQSAYLPSLHATLSATKGKSGTLVQDVPQLSYDVNTTTRDRSLNLSWTLFDFGLRNANLKNARQLLRAANATQDATLQKVFITVAQSYYDLLTAHAALEASMEAEKSARESFMAADAKYRAGVGALADKLQAQTNFGQATLNRVKADGELKGAQGALAIAMGLNANTPMTIDTGNAALPDTAFLDSVDALIDDAKRHHPSLLAAQAQLMAAQASVDAAKAEGMPTVSLTGMIGRNDQLGQRPTDTFVRTNSIGIQLKIPLYEGFGRSYRIQSALAQAESRTVELANTEQQISLDVWKSYQALRTETENLKATEDLLQSAGQSFNVAQGRYKAGVGNILELLGAQSALASAQQQRIQALSNWRLARLKLAASLGKLGMWAIE